MIPDSLPVISSGKHKHPSEGACVMEYVSMLAGEEFTDYPKCTHRALARAAQSANDTLPDARRHEMVSRINRLFGTNTAEGEEAKRISIGLAKFSASHAKRSAAYATANAAFTAAAANAAATAANAAATAAPANAAGRLKFLDDLLDEYDLLSGRTNTEDVVCKLPSVAMKVGV